MSELYCSGTNLLIDKIVYKARLSSRLASGMIIIGIIIRENNKLQNFGHVKWQHRIKYSMLNCVAKKVYA